MIKRRIEGIKEEEKEEEEEEEEEEGGYKLKKIQGDE